jgi:hypothetical protein
MKLMVARAHEIEENYRDAKSEEGTELQDNESRKSHYAASRHSEALVEELTIMRVAAFQNSLVYYWLRWVRHGLQPTLHAQTAAQRGVNSGKDQGPRNFARSESRRRSGRTRLVRVSPGESQLPRGSRKLGSRADLRISVQGVQSPI